MNFNIKTLDIKNAITTIKTGTLVIGIFENYKLTFTARGIIDQVVNKAIRLGDITGKPGSTLLLQNLIDITAERVLLIGLGNEHEITEKNFIISIQTLISTLSTLGANDAVLILPLEQIQGRNIAWAIYTIIMISHDQNYRFDILKSKKDPILTGVKEICIALPINSKITMLAKNALMEAMALVNGIKLTKDLGNLPSNICTPVYLANIAENLAKEFKLDVEILNLKQLQALKMGSFLSVANSSTQPPKLIVLKYLNNKTTEDPIVLVGKGITFDTGGISLKPSNSMDEMKYDMCGGAAVLGIFHVIAELKIKLNVIGIIPTCENMFSGQATKPGDVVTSMSGQTIEVLNTDAEGRLILCDALTYVERFKPAIVIDIATLTGACVVALGHHNSGLFTREDLAHELLATNLLAAGKETGDAIWRMPIQEAYQEQLKSNFADMANIGGQPAGSITAACFLERFTKKYTWAHIDIAGTAWKNGITKGATGRPVPLLVNYLLSYAKKQRHTKS